jgi:hypothetical protein
MSLPSKFNSKPITHNHINSGALISFVLGALNIRRNEIVGLISLLDFDALRNEFSRETSLSHDVDVNMVSYIS